MQKPLRLALLMTLLLAIPIARAIAAEYTHVLFLPSVSRNTNPPIYDRKEINGLIIWADCGYGVDDSGERHGTAAFHIHNTTGNTIRFTDDRSTYVYDVPAGAGWSEASRFPDVPFTIAISVVGGNSASLYVWCLVLTPTPEPTLDPLASPTSTPSKPMPTIAPPDPTSPPPPPAPPTEAAPPPKLEPTTAPSP